MAAPIAEVGEASIYNINIVVAGQLRYGAVKSGSRQFSERVDLLLSVLETLQLKPPRDER